jgi:hypothetical protein
LILAIIAGAAFIPVIWIFGSRMSRSLKTITAQAVKLQKLSAPDPSPVTSRIEEIHELGRAMELAQRTIWSFAHFVPKENAREANRAVAANGQGNFLKMTKAIENGVPVGIALRGDKMIEWDYRLLFLADSVAKVVLLRVSKILRAAGAFFV